MLDALRFVQGAIARKDFVPEMTHFHIRDGMVMTYNGAMTLMSPIALDFNASPKAEQMIKAIASCRGDTITLHMTDKWKLSIRSGGFKALVDCYQYKDESPFFPLVQGNDNEVRKFKTPILPILKKLYPFVGEDASRPWARGILLKDECAYVTNNIIVIEHWLGGRDSHSVPINIPKSSVSEMLRIGEEPEQFLIEQNSILLFYSDKRVLKAQTYSTEWPDLSRVLVGTQCNRYPLTDEIWDGVEQLIPLTDKMTSGLFLKRNSLSTHLEEVEGAVVSYQEPIFELDKPVLMNINQFYKLKGVADWIHFPTERTCTFTGENLRGAIAGMTYA